MTEFWYNDYKVLFETPDIIIPTSNMSTNEKLNAITRFCIYYSLLILLFRLDKNYLLFPITLVIFGLISYTVEPVKIEEKKCTESTIDNPYKNVIFSDYFNPERKAACENDEIKVQSNMNYNLYENEKDWKSRRMLDLAFSTLPVTTIPNDQTSFAKQLYNVKETCKEDGYNCQPNIDLSMRSKYLYD